MIRKYLLFLIIILCSCYHDPKEPSFDMGKIIPADSMVIILTDFQLLEGAFTLKERKSIEMNKTSMVYTEEILSKHRISRDSFEESMRYYTYHIDEMDEIFEKVVINLSKLESEVNKK